MASVICLPTALAEIHTSPPSLLMCTYVCTHACVCACACVVCACVVCLCVCASVCTSQDEKTPRSAKKHSKKKGEDLVAVGESVPVESSLGDLFGGDGVSDCWEKCGVSVCSWSVWGELRARTFVVRMCVVYMWVWVCLWVRAGTCVCVRVHVLSGQVRTLCACVCSSYLHRFC